MSIRRMSDLELSGKRVLIRQDLNVPMQDGRIVSDARIKASLPTIKMAIEQGATVLLMSHLGRPKEGIFDTAYSLEPVARYLTKLVNREVRLVRDYLGKQPENSNGEILLCENVRFNAGEKANDPGLAARYAALCDIFVMDAFGSAHRAQASTHGVGLAAPIACAGPLLMEEINALQQVLDNPAHPVVAIVGGSKVSTKLKLLESLLAVVDQLIVGGGIANTFIAAKGHSAGKSIVELDFMDAANRVLAMAEANEKVIPIPVDVIVGEDISESAEAKIKDLDSIEENDLVLDIGPDTARAYAKLLQRAGTILWNGPVGVFELEQFGNGTRTMAEVIAESPAFSVAGGGDTLAAIDQYQIADKISYISTGGGAFLEFLEGRKLPALKMLEKAAG